MTLVCTDLERQLAAVVSFVETTGSTNSWRSPFDLLRRLVASPPHVVGVDVRQVNARLASRYGSHSESQFGAGSNPLRYMLWVLIEVAPCCLTSAGNRT